MTQALTTSQPGQVSKYNEADIRQEMTILRSAFPKLKAGESEMRALVIAARWSGLSPFRGEIYYVPGIGITVAAKIRANDAISYQARIGNTLAISFDRVAPEMCIEGTDFHQYAGLVEKTDIAFLCRIISSKQRKDYYEMRLQIITELRALGYAGRDLENETNRRSGKSPETRALGIVKGAEDFGESGKKFVAFGREDRAMKRALTKTLAIGGYAAPDMRGYGGVSLDGERAIDTEYTVSRPDPIAPGVTINGGSDIIDHDEQADDWKEEIKTLGLKAGELIAKAPTELGVNLSVAQSLAREVLRKNGHSTAEERKQSTESLKTAIKAVEDAQPT